MIPETRVRIPFRTPSIKINTSIQLTENICCRPICSKYETQVANFGYPRNANLILKIIPSNATEISDPRVKSRVRKGATEASITIGPVPPRYEDLTSSLSILKNLNRTPSTFAPWQRFLRGSVGEQHVATRINHHVFQLGSILVETYLASISTSILKKVSITREWDGGKGR